MMFAHPVSIVGYVVAALGWVLLYSGGVSDVGYGARQVVNMHTLWIGSGLILHGGFLMLAGVVASGFAKFGLSTTNGAQRASSEGRGNADAAAKADGANDAAELDPAEALRRQLVERGLKR